MKKVWNINNIKNKNFIPLEPQSWVIEISGGSLLFFNLSFLTSDSFFYIFNIPSSITVGTLHICLSNNLKVIKNKFLPIFWKITIHII